MVLGNFQSYILLQYYNIEDIVDDSGLDLILNI